MLIVAKPGASVEVYELRKGDIVTVAVFYGKTRPQAQAAAEAFVDMANMHKWSTYMRIRAALTAVRECCRRIIRKGGRGALTAYYLGAAVDAFLSPRQYLVKKSKGGAT